MAKRNKEDVSSVVEERPDAGTYRLKAGVGKHYLNVASPRKATTGKEMFDKEGNQLFDQTLHEVQAGEVVELTALQAVAFADKFERA